MRSGRIARNVKLPFWLKCSGLVATVVGTGVWYVKQCGLQFDWNGGMWSEITAWEKSGQYVYVIPMVHIGEKRFYDDVVDVCKGSIVLLEGIDMTPLPAPIRVVVRLINQIILIVGIIVVGSFIDISSFIRRVDPTPRKSVVCQEDFFTPSVCCNSFPIMSDVHTTSTASLIAGRNDYLMKVFDTIPRQQFFPISIPWGAAHTPGISSSLSERGYSPVGVRYIRIGSISELISHLFRMTQSRLENRNVIPMRVTMC